MFAGHFGLAAGVTATRSAGVGAAGSAATRSRVPLWALLLATQFLDVIFVFLYLANVEGGTGSGYGGLTIHAWYTHSLVGAVALALIAGGLAWWRWGRTGGLTIAAVVFSHWLLDLVVHRPDLPILPDNAGNLPLLGFGLWRTPWASALAEAALVVAGVLLYRRSLRAQGVQPRKSTAAALILATLLAASLAADLAGF